MILIKMLCGSESCMKRIKAFENKRPKNRLALKKKPPEVSINKKLKKYL